MANLLLAPVVPEVHTLYRALSYAITASSKIEGAMCGIQLGNHVAPSLLELNGRYSKDKIIRQGDRVGTSLYTILRPMIHPG